jgi:hypothetical protein
MHLTIVSPKIAQLHDVVTDTKSQRLPQMVSGFCTGLPTTVILSVSEGSSRKAEMLRCTQHDKSYEAVKHFHTVPPKCRCRFIAHTADLSASLLPWHTSLLRTSCPHHNHPLHTPASITSLLNLKIRINHTALSIAVPVAISRHPLRHRRNHIL